MQRIRGRVLVLACAAAVAVAAGVGYAAIPAGDGTITGCYLTAKGTLRIVAGADECKKNEQALTWNKQGPAGAPGADGAAGAKGDPGEPGAPGVPGPRRPTGATRAARKRRHPRVTRRAGRHPVQHRKRRSRNRHPELRAGRGYDDHVHPHLPAYADRDERG